MKNRNHFIVVLSCLIAVGLFSCAKNNKEDILSNAGGCDTSSVGYAADIAPILEQYCNTAGCHNATSVAAGYDFTDYNKVKDAVLGPRFFGTINHEAGFSPMPKGSAKLTDCQIKKITIWVDNGAQNN